MSAYLSAQMSAHRYVEYGTYSTYFLSQTERQTEGQSDLTIKTLTFSERENIFFFLETYTHPISILFILEDDDTIILLYYMNTTNYVQ